MATAACADGGLASSLTPDIGGTRDMTVSSDGPPVGGENAGGAGGSTGGSVGGAVGGENAGGGGGSTGGSTGGTGGTGGLAPPECDDGANRGCSLDGCPDDPARKGTQVCEGGVWTACVAEDVCNDRDDDCDGVTDEDVEGKGAPCEAGVGACLRAGVQVCDEFTNLVCDAAPGAPMAEICDDGIDDDCNGAADDGCAPPLCMVDADCAAGEVCTNGVCERPMVGCLEDADCAPGELCLVGECQPAPPECNDDFDCPAGEICAQGACELAPPECVVDADCRIGEICVAEACEPAPAECAVDLDCDPGEVCENGACVLPPGGCRNDGDCAVGELCDAGVCAPIPPACVPDAHEEDDDVAAAVAAGLPASVDLNHCDDAVDWHTFPASVGSAYDIRTSNLGPAADTVVELYDVDGATLIDSNDDVAPGDTSSRIAGWQPVAGGIYYVAVRSFGDDIGADREYTLNIDEACLDDVFEDDDVQADAGRFAVGAGTENRRHCDPDWTGFAAVAGTTYVIETANLVGQTDTILELYETDGATLISTNDDYNGTLASRLEFLAPAAGTYYVRVGAFNDVYGGERGYTLDIRSAVEPQCAVDADCGPGNTCQAGLCVPDPVRCEADANEEDDDLVSARVLNVGQQFQGLSFCDDAMDWTRFDAVAGATYDFQTFNLAPGTDTVLDLYAADGVTLVASNDDGAADGLASLIAGWTAPADGPHYLLTRSYGDAFGPDRLYSVGIREACTDDAFEHDDDQARARPLAVGAPVEAHSHCEDADWVSFEAAAGTTYVISTSGLVDDDTLIVLYDAAGVELGRDDDGAGNLASRLQFTAPADGVYAVRVGTFGETYGGARAYGVQVTTARVCQLNADCGALEICDAGVCVPRPVQCVADADCDPGFSCDAGLCVETPRCVPDANEDDDALAQARPLQIGTPIRLNHCDDAADHFTFDAAAGLTLDFATTALGLQADTVLVVLDTDGRTVLARNDDGGGNGLASQIVGWVAPAAGQYTLVVESLGTRFGNDRDYTLIAYETCVDDAFEQDDVRDQRRPIALGEVQAHAHCADEDWVAFVAEAGREYRIDTSDLVGGADTVVELYAADGVTLLAQDDDGGGGRASRIVYTPEAAGELSVRVRSYNDLYGGARAYAVSVAQNVGGCAVDADCGVDQICQGGVCVAAPPRCVPDANEEDDLAADARLLTVGRNVDLNFCDDGSDWLAFDAEAGLVYDFQTFNLDAAGATDTLLALVDTDGVTELRRNDDVGNGDLSSLIAGWAAPATGRYFLHVTSFLNRTGLGVAYSVGIRETCADDAFENDDALAQARDIVVGAPAQARALCQDQDWARFVAIAGRGYRIETLNLLAGTDTVVTLYAADGTALATDDDSNGNAGSRIDWVAPANGTFSVEVTAFGGAYGGATGYELRVSEIDAAGICVVDADCGPGALCVSGACVLQPGACRVDADCPAGLACVNAACQAVVRCTPDANEADDVVADAKLLSEGRSVALNFCDDDTDWLSVDLVANARYDLFTEALEGATDTVLVLVDANGVEVARNDDGGGGRRSLIDDFVAPTTGRYSLAVFSYGEAFGEALSYRVGVVPHCTEDVYEDDDTIDANHVFAGVAERHAHCRDEDWLTVDVSAGVLTTIETTVEGGADTQIELFDAAGALFGADDDGGPGLGSLFAFTPAADGQIFVRIAEFGDTYGGTKAYTVDVRGGCRADADCAVGETCVAGACQVLACQSDAYEQDDARDAPYFQSTLDVLVDHNFCDDAADWTSVDLVRGVAYDFETMGLTAGTDTVLELYAPGAANPSATNDDGGRVVPASLIDNFVAPATGRYLLLTRSFSGAADGAHAYRLSLRQHCTDDALEDDDSADEATLVNVGAAPVAHNLCADADWIAFQAVAGRAYTLSTSALQGGADTVITLFDVDGTSPLDANDDGPNGLASEIAGWVAPADGTYFLRTESFRQSYGGGRAYSVAVTAN
jgi:Cys-rich repeat protein